MRKKEIYKELEIVINAYDLAELYVVVPNKMSQLFKIGDFFNELTEESIAKYKGCNSMDLIPIMVNFQKILLNKINK